MDLDSIYQVLPGVSLLRARIVAAFIFLAVLLIPSNAAAMTHNDFGGGKIFKKVLKISETPMSTDTNPDVIRKTVRDAWLAEEFQWSSESQWYCFDQIIRHESGWNPWSDNGAGWEETGGIPQAHPSRKMASAGDDYRQNVWTQVKWGLDYIESVYGTPCNAWDRWQSRAANGRYGWY